MHSNSSARAIRLLLCSLFLSAAAASASTPRQVRDGTGAFATGHYRNLFEETGHTQAQIDAKINGVFDQLFDGDPKTQALYYSAEKMRTVRSQICRCARGRTPFQWRDSTTACSI